MGSQRGRIMKPEAIVIRPIRPDDDMDALTALLHRAYAALGAVGLNYTAVDQSVEVTRSRFAAGLGLAAVDSNRRIIGTVVFHPPDGTGGSPWLDRPDVAHFGQFAVEPDRQKQGIGLRLMDAVEAQARAAGATEIALDTAEPAQQLIDWYIRRGYRLIEYAQWRGKYYRSAILSKDLRARIPGVSADLACKVDLAGP
jgi:predicted N-acetyltransferase YhbS